MPSRSSRRPPNPVDSSWEPIQIPVRTMATEIYQHSDYREFLREICREKKARDPRFSVRGLATRAKVDHSLLSKVLGGQRHLAPSLLAGVAKALGMDKAESSYLEVLADRSRAKSDAERLRVAGNRGFHDWKAYPRR